VKIIPKPNQLNKNGRSPLLDGKNTRRTQGCNHVASINAFFWSLPTVTLQNAHKSNERASIVTYFDIHLKNKELR
jgi:hypothetical protein